MTTPSSTLSQSKLHPLSGKPALYTHTHILHDNAKYTLNYNNIVLVHVLGF